MDSKYGVITSRSLRRVSLVVLMIDDLTGRTVTGSNARAWIEQEKPPIRKSDGFHVFLDLAEGDYEVKAEGGFYAQTSVPCHIGDEKIVTLTIRLMPNALYPVPSDCLRIEGQAEPHSEVIIYSQDKNTAYKLLSDAKKGTGTVGIYHSDSVNIEGKLLKVIAADGKGELLRVSEQTDKSKSEYRLSGKLSKDYPKVGTIVAPAFRTESDESGRFTLVLKNSFAKDSQIVCETGQGKSAKTKTFPVGASKYLKLDLLKKG